MVFKVLKVATKCFICNIVLKNGHNQSINSLEAFSFKMLSEEGRIVVNSLFWNNLALSQAHNKFLLNLKKDWEDDLNFYLKKWIDLKVPEERISVLYYIKYCREHFGK